MQINIPATEMAKWEGAAAPVAEEWIKDTPDGKRLQAEAVGLVRKYSN